MRNLVLIAILVASFNTYGEVIEHSGRTDISGCHLDHRDGSYHCH